MARGHADALAPMVEEVMRGLDGGFASLSRIAVATGPGSFTGIRVGLAMARAMAVALAIPVVGVSTLAAFAGRCSARPVLESSPRRSTPATARSISSCSSHPAGRWRRRAAIPRANACGRLAPARHGFAGDAAALIANEAHRAGLPYDIDAARDAPDIVALACIGLAVDPATSPARPLYVKPPDARPNPAAAIARAPA